MLTRFCLSLLLLAAACPAIAGTVRGHVYDAHTGKKITEVVTITAHDARGDALNVEVQSDGGAFVITIDDARFKIRIDKTCQLWFTRNGITTRITGLFTVGRRHAHIDAAVR